MSTTTTATAQSIGDWLAQMTPEPPPALADRLRVALQAQLHLPVSALPDACLDAANIVLAQLLTSGSTSRETALDLLAVDALVTCAFEVAADEPARLLERAANAMRHIAAFPAVHSVAS